MKRALVTVLKLRAFLEKRSSSQGVLTPLLFYLNCVSDRTTSKVWSTFHRKVEENLDDTLKRLGTDYLDCTLGSRFIFQN